jgi:hypothetical protein
MNRLILNGMDLLNDVWSANPVDEDSQSTCPPCHTLRKFRDIEKVVLEK